jgi:hypothetical protein
MIPLSVFSLVTILTFPGYKQYWVHEEIKTVDYSRGMFAAIHFRFVLCYSLLFKSIKCRKLKYFFCFFNVVMKLGIINLRGDILKVSESGF